MISQRRPWLAALLSLVAPGLGQLYAGRPNAALGFALGLQVVGWVVLSLWVLLPPSQFIVLIGFLILLSALAAAVANAGVAAYRAGPSYELRPYNRWYGYLAAFVLLTLWHRSSAWLAKRNLAEPFRIPSAAMEPTLLVGDFIYVAKLPRSLLTPQHEAIVVFLSVEDSTPYLHLVKRVIGTSGDTLQMVRDTVYRNGQRLDEPYTLHLAGDRIHDDEQRLRQIRAWQMAYYLGPDSSHYRPTTRDWGPIVVPQNHCFVMGDNREQSYDSRYYGFVPFANIRGQPRFLYFSYDPAATAVRWPRIGRAIL